METRFHTQVVVENPNPHQNRKDNPPQELRCGRAHVQAILEIRDTTRDTLDQQDMEEKVHLTLRES